MSAMTTKTEFSFLTSGPPFRFDLPLGFEPSPELSSPVISGVGARDFVFTPNPQGEELAVGLAQDGELLRVLSDNEGRLVNQYRRLEPPLTWWLVWQLTDGCLTTHLREIDGIDQAKIVVASLSIVEDGSIPFLLLDPPLRSAASARPDFVERAMFNSLGSETVVFLRPGFLAPGKIMAFPSDDWIQLRAGTGYGMEVQVISSRGRSAAEAVLFGILESLNEA